MDESTGESIDIVPGSDIGEHAKDEQMNRRRLFELAREADKLHGEKDEKLQKAVKLIKGLLDEGYNPIIFCRFIPTAEYVAETLRKKPAWELRLLRLPGHFLRLNGNSVLNNLWKLQDMSL